MLAGIKVKQELTTPEICISLIIYMGRIEYLQKNMIA